MWTLTLKKTRSKKEAVRVILSEDEMEEVAEWVEKNDDCDAGFILAEFLAGVGAAKVVEHEVVINGYVGVKAYSEDNAVEVARENYPELAKLDSIEFS